MNEHDYFQELLNELYRKVSLDPEIRSIMKEIEKRNADFSDTARLSGRVSDLLGEVLSAHVEELPEGMREAVCKALLRERYEGINALLADVQEALDEAQGLHLNPVRAPYPAERVQQLAHSLEDPGVPAETIVRRANTGAANVCRSFHDDYIRENARVRNDLGLKCYVTRTGSSKACKWCAEMFGKYAFGDVPKDIFRRHDSCNCTIVYDNQVLRGSVGAEGRRTRSWEVIGEELPKEYQPTVLTREQAQRLENQALQGLTLAGRRDIIRSIDVDDFETVIYGKGVLQEVSDTIVNTMKQCEKNGGFVISEISASVVSTSAHGTPVLQIEPMANGLLQLNVNTEYLSGKTLEEINRVFMNTKSTVVDSLEEAVIHESGHAISIKGKSAQKVADLYKELKDAGLPGVSLIASEDGAECLAELEVLRYRGSEVSKELSDFYEKYMGREY